MNVVSVQHTEFAEIADVIAVTIRERDDNARYSVTTLRNGAEENRTEGIRTVDPLRSLHDDRFAVWTPRRFTTLGTGMMVRPHGNGGSHQTHGKL